MRGPFEVAASPCFCSLGFLIVAFLLPSSLRSGSRQPRPALSVFVCFMAAPFVSVDDPSPSVYLSFSLSRRSSFAFSGRTFRALVCVFLFSPSPPYVAASRPYIRHSCGIAPSLGIALQPSSSLRWEVPDLRRCSSSLRPSGGYFKNVLYNVCIGRVFSRYFILQLPHIYHADSNSEADIN